MKVNLKVKYSIKFTETELIKLLKALEFVERKQDSLLSSDTANFATELKAEIQESRNLNAYP